MATNVRAPVLVVLIFLASIYENQCQVNSAKTFRAIGEILDIKSRTLIYFEENYDEALLRSSISFTFNGTTEDINNKDSSATYLEYQDKQQSFVYSSGGKICEPDSQKKWIKNEPESRTVKDGISVYSIQQLIGLPDSMKNKMKQDEKKTYRGIPAKVSSYSFTEGDTSVEINAFWSDETYHSTSRNPLVPLGFEINKIVKGSEEISAVIISVFMFMHRDTNSAALQPIRGTYCEKLGVPDKFPKVTDLPGFIYKTEFLFADFLTVSFVDAWIDPITKLYKIDYLPVEEFNMGALTPTQDIISLDQQAVYSTRGSKTTVKKLSDVKADPQMLIDPKDPTQLKLDAWFGVDSIKYMQIAEVQERGVPCMLYHGVRSDWPKDPIRNGDKIKTLWEWCIANEKKEEVDFMETRYPVISLNIRVLSSTNTFYYEGLTMTHNFHKAKALEPIIETSASFDISHAFKDEDKKTLEFAVTVSNENRESFKAALNDPRLLWEFRNTIFTTSSLSVSSLRVSNVQIRDSTSVSGAADKGILVLVTLLGIHPDLPKDVEKISLSDATSKLESVINDGKFVVEYMDSSDPKNIKTVAITGKPKSLRETSWTKTSSLPINPDSNLTRYGAGTMAAVAIVMLLLGLSIGAGGLFLKKRYVDAKRTI